MMREVYVILDLYIRSIGSNMGVKYNRLTILREVEPKFKHKSEGKMIKCFECDSVENIHNHHVVPKVKGGTKTIPLCEVCHGKVHGRDFTNHKKLTKEGLKRAKDRGVILGSPENLTKEAKKKSLESIKRNRLENENWKICKEFIDDFIKSNGKVHYSKISNLLNEQGYRTRRGCLYKPHSVQRIHLNFPR